MPDEGNTRYQHGIVLMREGHEALHRARLVAAVLAILFAAHLEFILFPHLRAMGPINGILALLYPLVLVSFIISLLRLQTRFEKMRETLAANQPELSTGETGEGVGQL